MTTSELNWLLASIQLGALDWLAIIASQPESKLYSKEALEYLSDEQARLRKLLTNIEKRIEAEREPSRVIQNNLFDFDSEVAG